MRARGFVLTGGGSRRMGADKALLSYAGGPLAEYVARQVEGATGAATFVGAPERYGHLRYPCLAERYPGCGPMSGVQTALSALEEADWALVTACDMPGLSTEWLQKMLKVPVSDSLAVVTGNAGGGLEPLCALYHRRLLEPLDAALVQGRYSLHKFLLTIPFIRIEAPSEALLANVNTSEEWATWNR